MRGTKGVLFLFQDHGDDFEDEGKKFNRSSGLVLFSERWFLSSIAYKLRDDQYLFLRRCT